MQAPDASKTLLASDSANQKSTAAPVLSPWTAAWGSSDYQRFRTIGNWKSRDHILSPINPFRSRTNQRCAPSSACPAPGPPLESRRRLPPPLMTYPLDAGKLRICCCHKKATPERVPSQEEQSLNLGSGRFSRGPCEEQGTPAHLGLDQIKPVTLRQTNLMTVLKCLFASFPRHWCKGLAWRSVQHWTVMEAPKAPSGQSERAHQLWVPSAMRVLWSRHIVLYTARGKTYLHGFHAFTQNCMLPPLLRLERVLAPAFQWGSRSRTSRRRGTALVGPGAEGVDW